MSLFNLLVREKGDTRDSLGLYLISQNKQNPEMYEILCRSASDRQAWAKALRAAVEKCPEEGMKVLSLSDLSNKLGDLRKVNTPPRELILT